MDIQQEEKILRLLGLARRAGAVIWGLDATIAAMNDKKVFFLILAKDIGKNTEKKIQRILVESEFVKENVCQISSAENLGFVTGGKARAILGITDVNFAKGMQKALEEA